MKKNKRFMILLFSILGLFLVIGAVTYYGETSGKKETKATSQTSTVKPWKNPYGNKILKPDTIAQLHNPNYQNLILPEEMEKRIANKDSFFVYFYSPSCSHCKVATPIVNAVAKDMNTDVKQFNLLEFEDGWDKYGIQGTPTLVYYQKGKPVSRIEGEQTPQVFARWFTLNK